MTDKPLVFSVEQIMEVPDCPVVSLGLEYCCIDKISILNRLKALTKKLSCSTLQVP